VTSENETKESAGPESSDQLAKPSIQVQAEHYLDQLTGNGGDVTPENIDAFLELQDPEFSQKLTDIKKDSELWAANSEVDLDSIELHDEIALWRDAKGLKRSCYVVLPFLPRISLAIKKLKFRLFAFSHATTIRAKHFFYYLATTGRKKAQAKIIDGFKAMGAFVSALFSDVGRLSLRLKLALLGLILLLGASGGVFFLTWKGKLIPKERALFMTDLSIQADEIHEVVASGGFENFYDNVRSTPNLLLIEKVVVNLKRNKNSGTNPMLAAEFFVEGLNPEVVIEVKDREAFFRDLIQRTAEDFSFDQLSTVDGKQLLVQALFKEMNRSLTTGELRFIRVKTFILKP
jgi:flagellar basal body-associated protein FliL